MNRAEKRRLEREKTKAQATYTFKGVPTYNSYSAMVPCGSKKNPYEFMYYDFDEDEGTGDGWTGIDLYNPLAFQTEKEFLERIGGQST